jgi:protein-S-isoprenylcysteine O-methyltransferase Ste14
MDALGLILLVAWLAVVGGVRGSMHARRTGELAIHGRDRPGSPQWWSKVLSSVGLVVAFAAAIAQIAGIPPLPILALGGGWILATALVATGTALTVISQFAMGDSWRGDVDPAARTALVTSGPFQYVRNPTLLGTVIAEVGLVLVMPNVLALAMLALALISIQIQVRLVEEPYLRDVHGEAYVRYAARTGRFLPWLGRLEPSLDRRR